MRKSRPLSLFCFMGCLLVFLWGCASFTPGPIYEKEGRVYGKTGGNFRHRWWNYYERGLSYQSGGFFEDAARDFLLAVSRRNYDQRMARSYGMHFVDYFPHRELGICFFFQKRYERAKQELELSLGQYPSSKSYFYLNLVRKELILKSKKAVPPPFITLGHGSATIWSRNDPFVLSGSAKDDHYLTGITVMGDPVFFEGSRQSVAFQKRLNLAGGSHLIEVAAENLMGRTAKKELTVIIDREGPVIALTEIRFDKTAQPLEEMVVCGSIYDRAGVERLTLNGQEVLFNRAREGSFCLSLPLETDMLTVEARDVLGNQTSFHGPILPRGASFLPVRVAGLSQDCRGIAAAAFGGDEKAQTPVIELKAWGNIQTVFLEKIYLEGCITCNQTIKSIRVNGVPVILPRGRMIFFSQFIELAQGENIISLEAEDVAGNGAEKKITVIRKIPKALQLAERLSLTVLPFKKDGVLSKDCISFQDDLMDALVARNRFRVVDRDIIDLLLREHRLGQSSLMDRDTVLKLKKLMPAKTVVAGSMIENDMGIEIVSRVFDSETLEVLTVADAYGENKDPAAFRSMARGMALKLHREFPMATGKILEKKGKFLFMEMGEVKMKCPRRLIVYKEKSIKDPVKRKLFGSDIVILGRARTVEVGDLVSKARLMKVSDKGINSFDLVISE